MKVEILINYELFKNKSKFMNIRFLVFNWCVIYWRKKVIIYGIYVNILIL